MQENNKQLIELRRHLKELRKQKKLTLEVLCYRNGLELSAISRVEKGMGEPKCLTMKKLAKAYNLTLS